MPFKIRLTVMLLLVSAAVVIVVLVPEDKVPGMAPAVRMKHERKHAVPGDPADLGAAPPELQPFVTDYTLARLAAEHDVRPGDEEWPELTRILLHAVDERWVGAVSARFAMHAGTAELAVLANAYDDPPNDDTRQRLIELFSSLQSADSIDAARQILSHEDLPITDHLVCACAISLIRFGQPEDLKTVFGRLNLAGDDPLPEGSLYSEADGLMYAISEAEHPALQPMLMTAAEGHLPGGQTDRSRMAALMALRNYTNVPSTRILYRVSTSGTNQRLREQAQASLKKIQTPD